MLPGGPRLLDGDLDRQCGSSTPLRLERSSILDPNIDNFSFRGRGNYLLLLLAAVLAPGTSISTGTSASPSTVAVQHQVPAPVPGALPPRGPKTKTYLNCHNQRYGPRQPCCVPSSGYNIDVVIVAPPSFEPCLSPSVVLPHSRNAIYVIHLGRSPLDNSQLHITPFGWFHPCVSSTLRLI